MDLEHQRIAEVVGYSCIFESTPESAAQHILKLMSQNVGFEKEPDYYRTKFSEILATYPLESLSRFGARFSVEQWRSIFETILTRLENGKTSES